MKKILVPIIFVLLLLTAVLVAAQGGLEIPWHSIDGGAQTVSGGDYILNGISGQPDAGAAMSGGDFVVSGGYWAASTSGESQGKLFLPVVLK